jgi:ABC-type amino acid transport substrate-binding protein
MQAGMVKKAIRLSAGLAFSFMASCSHAEDTLTRIRDTHTITIANREASLPFSYLDENNRPAGYAIDLCLKIAEAVRRELKLPQLNIAYLTVTPGNRIPAIVEGKADIECGSTANNADRRRQVAFTIPHFIAGARMLVRADSGIKNWPDLRDKRVVTTQGTTMTKLLNDSDKVRALGLKLVEARNHKDAFSMVEKREAQAFAMDDVLLYGLRAGAKNPSDFLIVGDMLSTEAYAIMLRRDDAPFKALVDREMSRIIADGEMSKLYDKWFMNPLPNGLNFNMPMGYLLRDAMRFPSDKVAD